MYVMRCKGVCGNTERRTACAATIVKQKKVKMMVKTHFQGRDSTSTSWLACGEQKIICERRVSIHWDLMSCQCKSKSVAPRGADTQDYDCYGANGRFGYNPPSDMTIFDILSYIVLGSSITTAMFLSATTFYYRRKYKRLLNKEQKSSHTPRNTNIVKTVKPVWKHPNRSNHSYHNTNGFKMNTTERASSHRQPPNFHLDLHHNMLSPVAGEPFEDQYDEHGVKIEKQMDDAELLRHYMG